MKTIFFICTFCLSFTSFAHTPGQLNKYFNYYKLAHHYSLKQLKTKSISKAKKNSEVVCKKITRKFKNDPNYILACSAGIDDAIKGEKKQRIDLEKILHTTETEPDVDPIL